MIISERELLYGEDSLLARFGPLVTEICTRNTLYSVGSPPILGIERALLLMISRIETFKLRLRFVWAS